MPGPGVGAPELRLGVRFVKMGRHCFAVFAVLPEIYSGRPPVCGGNPELAGFDRKNNSERPAVPPLFFAVF